MWLWHIASQARVCDLNEFFTDENHAFPVSISEHGKLRTFKEKSKFTQLLHKVFKLKYEEPNVQIKVIGGTAFVNLYRPSTSKTFAKYYNDELVKIVYSFSMGVDRMDFVFDRYLEKALRRRLK